MHVTRLRIPWEGLRLVPLVLALKNYQALALLTKYQVLGATPFYVPYVPCTSLVSVTELAKVLH